MNAVVAGVLTIFASAAFVVFYFSCRCKHEQFDLALLAQSVGAETPADLAGGATPRVVTGQEQSDGPDASRFAVARSRNDSPDGGASPPPSRLSIGSAARFGAHASRMAAPLLRWILTPFQWLLDALAGLPGWLRWPIALGLVALLIVLVFHIGYTIVGAVRGPGRSRRPGRCGAAYCRAIRPARTPGGRGGSRGDLITAIRLLFVACLLRLELAEKRLFAGTTNREHLRRHRIRRSSSPSTCSSRSSRRGGTAGEYVGPKTSKPAGPRTPGSATSPGGPPCSPR